MDLKKHTELQKKIDKYKRKNTVHKAVPSGSSAFNIAVELVAAVIVGIVIGLLFDNLLDSKPLFLIICMMLAMIAAFRLIWNKYIKNHGK